MLLFVVIAVIAALGRGFVLSRSISTPLRRTVEVLNRAADGDLTSRLEVSTNDEVGQAGTALNKMLERTSEVVRAIGGNAGSLATSSDELSAVAQQLGASAEEPSAPSRSEERRVGTGCGSTVRSRWCP